MKKITCLTALASLAMTSFALAQEPAPRVALSLGAVNNYRFYSSPSRVDNHYALGSKVNLVLDDKWLVGFTQLTSVAPKNLLAAASGQGRTRLSEYALMGGYKWHLAPQAYATGSLQVGVGTLRQHSGSLAASLENWSSDDQATFFTAGAEAGIGYHLGKHLALEVGAAYHRYSDIDGLPVAAKELNNLSAALSLVGTIPLSKSR